MLYTTFAHTPLFVFLADGIGMLLAILLALLLGLFRVAVITHEHICYAAFLAIMVMAIWESLVVVKCRNWLHGETARASLFSPIGNNKLTGKPFSELMLSEPDALSATSSCFVNVGIVWRKFMSSWAMSFYAIHTKRISLLEV